MQNAAIKKIQDSTTTALHYSFFGLGCELQIYLVD